MDTKKQAEQKANAKILELVENDWKVARTSLSDKFIIYYEHGFKGDGTHEFPFLEVKPPPRGTIVLVRICGDNVEYNRPMISSGKPHNDEALLVCPNDKMLFNEEKVYYYWCSVTEPEKYHSEGWNMDWIKND